MVNSNAQASTIAIHFRFIVSFLLIQVSGVVFPCNGATYPENQESFSEKQFFNFCSAFFSMRDT